MTYTIQLYHVSVRYVIADIRRPGYTLYCNRFSNCFFNEAVRNKHALPYKCLYVPHKPLALCTAGEVLSRECEGRIAPPSNTQLSKWSSVSVKRLVDFLKAKTTSKVVHGKRF